MASQPNRRQFIRTAAIAMAAGPFIASSARSVPSERVRLAYIGCGGRARQMMPMFAFHPDADVIGVCDVNEPRMDQAAKLSPL